MPVYPHFKMGLNEQALIAATGTGGGGLSLVKQHIHDAALVGDGDGDGVKQKHEVSKTPEEDAEEADIMKRIDKASAQMRTNLQDILVCDMKLQELANEGTYGRGYIILPSPSPSLPLVPSPSPSHIHYCCPLQVQCLQVCGNTY